MEIGLGLGWIMEIGGDRARARARARGCGSPCRMYEMIEGAACIGHRKDPSMISFLNCWYKWFLRHMQGNTINNSNTESNTYP